MHEQEKQEQTNLKDQRLQMTRRDFLGKLIGAIVGTGIGIGIGALPIWPRYGRRRSQEVSEKTPIELKEKFSAVYSTLQSYPQTRIPFDAIGHQELEGHQFDVNEWNYNIKLITNHKTGNSWIIMKRNLESGQQLDEFYYISDSYQETRIPFAVRAIAFDYSKKPREEFYTLAFDSELGAGFAQSQYGKITYDFFLNSTQIAAVLNNLTTGFNLWSKSNKSRPVTPVKSSPI